MSCEFLVRLFSVRLGGRRADRWFGGGSAPKPASIAPPATAKARYMRDRFNIIKQVVLRNEHFSAPAIPDHLRSEYMKVRGRAST